MSDYPILVRRYRGQQSLTIVCESCEATMVVVPEDWLNEGLFACPDSCGGTAVPMYEEADSCPNCRELGFYEDVLDGCCSRVCQLQYEYARQLAEARQEAS